MKCQLSMPSSLIVAALLATGATGLGLAAKPGPAASRPLNVNPPPISTDKSIKYDYPIVYVRASRRGDDKQIAWTEVFSPLRGEPGSDLMLLHPDGREEVLVAAGDDAITDPFVSFDGESIYYARIHNVKRPRATKPTSQSSDIFRIHVRTRKLIQLTRQTFMPNTGVVAGSTRASGVYNLAPPVRCLAARSCSPATATAWRRPRDTRRQSCSCLSWTTMEKTSSRLVI